MMPMMAHDDFAAAKMPCGFEAHGRVSCFAKNL